MKSYGTIDFEKQKRAGMSVMEWLFLEQIEYLSNGSQSRKRNGWVYAKQRTLAEHLGVTERTIRLWIRSLIDRGWLLKDEDTAMIQTSDQWHDLQFCHDEEKISDETGKNFLPEPEKISAPTYKDRKLKRENKDKRSILTLSEKALTEIPKEEIGDEQVKVLSWLSEFEEYRKRIKKALKTTAPLIAFFRHLVEIERAGISPHHAIRTMQEREWMTLKLEYFRTLKLEYFQIGTQQMKESEKNYDESW